MTEFALVLPVLVVLIFGIIQFGITFNNYITLTDAVRAGARKGAVSRHEKDPVAVTVGQVKAAATDLKSADLVVEVESTWQPGDEVKVSASYPYNISLFGIPVKKGSINSATTERVE